MHLIEKRLLIKPRVLLRGDYSLYKFEPIYRHLPLPYLELKSLDLSDIKRPGLDSIFSETQEWSGENMHLFDTRQYNELRLKSIRGALLVSSTKLAHEIFGFAKNPFDAPANIHVQGVKVNEILATKLGYDPAIGSNN